MKRLLVTGGAGFIGSNFVYFWKKRYPQDLVVVLDALTYAGNIANLDGMKNVAGFEFVHGDILDTKLIQRIFTDKGIDTLVHFAAESHVDRSIHGPDAFVQTNVTGTLSLLKAAKVVWLDQGSGIPHRFHHVSTDEVYGSLGSDDPPFSEETPYAPNSPYAASKAGSDHLVRAFHKTYGLVTTISNCSNNYGPFQFPEKLIPLCITNVLNGKPLPVYGDGRQIRDWLYVDDHNQGIELILEKGQAGETYNIGGGNERTNIEIVGLICDLTDLWFKTRTFMAEKFPKALPVAGRSSRELITHVRDRAGHDRRYAIDAHKIKTALGYQPKASFETGIQKTVDWYLDHENWWRALMNKLCFSKM